MDSETSLAVRWLGLQASTAGGVGSIPGQETKILHVALIGQKKKEFWIQLGIKTHKKN